MSQQRQQIVGALYALAAIVAWGAYFPFAKLILHKIPPVPFLILRFGIGALVLIVMSVTMKRPLNLRRDDLPMLILAGTIGIIMHQLLQLHGLAYTSATNTGWILTIIPAVTGALGWMFLKERITVRQLSGLMIAMIGVLFFISDGRVTELSFAGNKGDLLALGSVFTWSTYTILTRSKLKRYDALPLTALHTTLGFVYFFFAGFDRVGPNVSDLSTTEWFIVIAIGVVSSGLAYYWWNAGLQRLGAMNTSVFLFIEAIVASVTAYFVLGEVFTTAKLVATGFIMLGVYITQTRR